MKKVNYALMGIAILCAIFSIYVNIQNGFQYWGWPLATIVWVINSYIQQRIIQRYERND